MICKVYFQAPSVSPVMISGFNIYMVHVEPSVQCTFDRSFKRGPFNHRDKSIPQLQDIETPTLNEDHCTIAALIDEQIEYEEFTREKATEEIENAGYPNRHMEAKPPRPKEEFSPARLLLSHLGYLSLEYLVVSSRAVVVYHPI